MSIQIDDDPISHFPGAPFEFVKKTGNDRVRNTECAADKVKLVFSD